jgi:hypothetical protein
MTLINRKDFTAFCSTYEVKVRNYPDIDHIILIIEYLLVDREFNVEK